MSQLIDKLEKLLFDKTSDITTTVCTPIEEGSSILL